MDYEEAVLALQAGDYDRAVRLFAPAARDANYCSDVINHFYTLALHHAGENAKLAEVAFEVGNRMLSDDAASALDYFQRALVAGLSARKTRQIGVVFEQWASRIGRGGEKPARPESIRRVAHVVGGLVPGSASSRYLQTLTRGLKSHRIESIVFTTEWASSWFFNPTGGPHSERIDMEADVRIASVEGDFCERADRITRSIRASDCQAVLFHANLTEQITARVAAGRPTPVQVHVNHEGEMDADLFDGRVHLFRDSLERTRFSDRLNRWIPPASDIESRLAPVRSERSEIGGATSISATFGTLPTISREPFLESLREILRRFPKHIHLFAGIGDVRAARNDFRQAEVLPQVRFLGHQTDSAHLLPQIDIYLASYQSHGWESVLDAMGAGKPVVVLGHAADSHDSSGAELVGVDELIASDPGQFVAIASQLIRDADYRDALAQAVQLRFGREFRPDNLGRRYAEFMEELSQTGTGA